MLLQVTLAGDFSAFLTAVFFCGYILIGGHLRQWLPIFLYATPVTGFAALLLSVSALVSGEVTLTGMGNTGIFGWVAMPYLPKVHAFPHCCSFPPCRMLVSLLLLSPMLLLSLITAAAYPLLLLPLIIAGACLPNCFVSSLLLLLLSPMLLLGLIAAAASPP